MNRAEPSATVPPIANGLATTMAMGFARFTNTMEGIWTGLRNFLRPFRGISKYYLSQYVSIFQFQHNFKYVSAIVLRIMLGTAPPNTAFAS